MGGRQVKYKEHKHVCLINVTCVFNLCHNTHSDWCVSKNNIYMSTNKFETGKTLYPV